MRTGSAAVPRRAVRSGAGSIHGSCGNGGCAPRGCERARGNPLGFQEVSARGAEASTKATRREPYAYESAFSVRWLIEEQVGGSPALNHDPNAGPVMAPWLAWGPYLWADGLVPRASDGLTWACGDFSTSDGTHPAETGRAKVAQMLLDFFTSDPTAAPWFTDALVGVEPVPAPGAALRIAAVWPNPARGVLFARVDAPRAMTARFDLVTVDGRAARRLPEARLEAGPNTLRWGELGDGGLAAGVYFLRAHTGGLVDGSARRLVLVP